MAEYEVEKIYFDMDGVLADFERGVREICGIEPPPQPQDLNEEEKMARKADDDKMWELIRKTGDFYYRLELMPGAKELFNAVYATYGDKVEILTGVPKEKRQRLTLLRLIRKNGVEKYCRRMLSLMRLNVKINSKIAAIKDVSL